MQNHPNTELHMHSDPQMRSRVQLFWSIITIHIFSTITSLRSQYAFWFTNEKPFATFLLDPNDSHFFDQIYPWEALAIFFTFKCNRSKYLTFDWSSRRGMLPMKKREKIRIIARGRVGKAFCNCPKPKLLLQKNECMIQWIEWKVSTSIVGKHFFRKYISFTPLWNSWIYREKKRILKYLENSCF